MRKNILFLLLLSSCFGAKEQPVVQKKQKQKIAVLQKKLGEAEKEQKKVQSEVKKISSEIDAVQLSLIRRQLDDYESKKEKIPNLFLDEREALYRMILSAPSPMAFEAQVELDRILRIITELSDKGKNV